MANYTGGTAGYHSQAIYGETDVSLGVLSSEWTALFRLENSNSGQAGASSQNVGIVGIGQSLNPAGYTWGSNFVAESQAGQVDTGHLVALELDNQNDTADPNKVRGILDMVVQPITPSSSTPEVAYGINLRASTSSSTPGRAQIGISFQIDLGIGEDFSTATFSTGGPAVRLGDGNFIDFSANNSHTLLHSSTDAAFEYKGSTIPQFIISDNPTGTNGFVFNPSNSGSSPSISSGGNSSDANASLLITAKPSGYVKLGASGSSGVGTILNGAVSDLSYFSGTPTAGGTTNTSANEGIAYLSPGSAINGQTFNLWSSPTDGQYFRIVCTNYVTNITLVPASSYTINGSSLVSCGPNGGSVYLWVRNKVWNILSQTAVNSVSPGMAAAGTTLATATYLFSYYNVIITATAGQGVALSAGTPVGGNQFVCNRSGVSIDIYPDIAGDQIESDGAGTPIAAASSTASCNQFFRASGSQWRQIQ